MIILSAKYFDSAGTVSVRVYSSEYYPNWGTFVVRIRIVLMKCNVYSNT